jgi:NTE family protein
MPLSPASAPEALEARAGVRASQPRKRVALVIGSGSVKCAAAIGVQQVLDRERIPVHLLVGCSAGSLFAAALAAGGGARDAADKTRRLWTRELTSRRVRWALMSVVLPRLFGFSREFGLRDDRLIMARLKEAFGSMTLAETRVPLHITATDFQSGEQVVISAGRVVDALRASIAIPFVFKPWRIGDRLCIDGFMSDPLPVGVAVREGADVVIAVGFESPYQEEVNSPGRFAFQLSSIMTNNLLRSAFAFHQLAHHDEVIPIVPRFPERIRLFDTGKFDMIIEAGARAAEEQVPYLRRLLAPDAR